MDQIIYYLEMKKHRNSIVRLQMFLSNFFDRMSKRRLLIPKIYDNFINSSKIARLMRLDKPVAYVLLILPVLWAIAFNLKDVFKLIYFFLLFSVGALVMRSAGCIINDIADRKLDHSVERTKNRPLTSGEVSLGMSLCVLAILLLLGVIILMQLPDAAIYIGFAAMLPITVYPFMKRFTHLAQFFLGFTFNIGVVIAWIAVTGYFSIHGLLLYVASAMWTAGYDTIYAHQDRTDDVLLGLKSTAIKFGENTPLFVWRMYQVAITAICIVGLALHMNIIFYAFMGIAAYHLYWQTETLDIHDAKSCGIKFKSNIEFGVIVLLGILLGHI